MGTAMEDGAPELENPAGLPASSTTARRPQHQTTEDTSQS